MRSQLEKWFELQLCTIQKPIAKRLMGGLTLSVGGDCSATEVCGEQDRERRVSRLDDERIRSDAAPYDARPVQIMHHTCCAHRPRPVRQGSPRRLDDPGTRFARGER